MRDDAPRYTKGGCTLKLTSLLAGVAAASALCTAPALAQDKPFEGVTVNAITQTGAIQEPLQRRAPDFEALTEARRST